ncbi:TPA: hypothetical protein ACPH2G_004589 [Pseudomonas aeruginosa]
MNKALDLLREIRPSIPKEVLELWCKDRDAFLASHPAVEQAGGDERAGFEAWLAQAMSHHFDPEFDLAKYEDSGEYRYNPATDYWKAWQARAALAQPSPKCATCGGTGMVDDGEITCSEGGIPYENGPVKCVKDCPDCKAQPSPAPELAERGTQHRFSTTEQTCRHDFYGVWWNEDGVTKTGRECRHCGFFVADVTEAQTEQAEAERPEVVASVVHSNPVVLGQCGPLNANDELMTVAQHAASVARWAEMFNRVEQERDAALARVAELEQKSAGSWTVDTSCGRPILMYEGCSVIEDQTAYEVIRMIKWIGELERQEPVATVAKVPGEDWNSLDFHRDLQHMQPGTKLYAAPVAQAQHSVPGDIMRDAQRYRWLRDQQFYFSFSTENSDAGISSCTAGMSSRFKNLSWVDAAIDSAIAAAPGKEVGHE